MRYFLIEEQKEECEEMLGQPCRLIEIKRARSTDDAVRLAGKVVEAEVDFPIAEARILAVAEEKEIDLTEIENARIEHVRQIELERNTKLTRRRSADARRLQVA